MIKSVAAPFNVQTFKWLKWWPANDFNWANNLEKQKTKNSALHRGNEPNVIITQSKGKQLKKQRKQAN